MLWPRPRFTMRMMIVVAVIAFAMGVEVMRRRHDSYRRKADSYVVEEKAALQSVEDLRRDEQAAFERFSSPEMNRDESTVPMDLRDQIKQRRRDLVAMKARVEWHARMGRKYVFAAAHPWLTVAADTPAPPIPEWVVDHALSHESFDKWFKQMLKSGSGASGRPAAPPGPASRKSRTL